MKEKKTSPSSALQHKSNKAAMELLSKLAHDFNDLLVGIEGSARMLLEGEMLRPEGMPLAEQILSCAQRANELTKEMHGHSLLGETLSLGETLPAEKMKGLLAGEEMQASVREEELNESESRPVVLLIDDEHVVRSVGRSILERDGFKVITAASGEEGIRKFERYSGSIHCVILDMVMPYMSGNLVFAKLKAAKPDARVLLISGYTDKQTLRQFQEHEIEGFLQKPFSPGTLVSKVRQIVSRANMASSRAIGVSA